MSVAFAVIFCGTLSAFGQNAAPSGQPRSSQAAAEPSAGQTALEKSAASGKYALVFFWKEKNQQTSKAWNSLKEAAAKTGRATDVISVLATDPAEKAIVDRFGVSRAPTPLTLAVAPCGAVTKGFTAPVDDKQLRTAFVSPCTERCLKSLQEGKLVFVCVEALESPAVPKLAPQGVRAFRDDQRFAKVTEVVSLNSRDGEEATFLKELQIDPKSNKAVTVFLGPPGTLIGKYDVAANKQQFVAALAAAQASPCAGGKCGPNGCGPKK